ncbi:unnamed protein product [Adineta steineri]|uniref:Uncharacterized protein n=1 Tax=Adineta steineri TaxID=433720 RepID=A0A814SRY1_9BILA|nr:unnamed protein product [Adineta steineri]CAF1455424.1 unnamed protein product [Adineta steineri]
MSGNTSDSISSNRYNQKPFMSTNRARTRFSPQGSSRSINNKQFSSNSDASHNLIKLDQLVDTLKSLKRLISHYFDQISKLGESLLAGDVRRVYRRILLLYVKYRRRQNYEKRRMKQPIEESDNDDDDDVNSKNSNKHSTETNNMNSIPTWTMKKIVSSQSLPFTRAGFDADQDGIEDFDEIALAATRDVANIQNHCVRLILNDHQMKLSVYGLQTRWDSEIPKQRKYIQSTTSTNNTGVQVIKKTGIKSSNIPLLTSTFPSIIPPPTTSDQELFLGSLARQLNEQTWQQLHSIFANLNSHTLSTSSTDSQEQIKK